MEQEPALFEDKAQAGLSDITKMDSSGVLDTISKFQEKDINALPGYMRPLLNVTQLISSGKHMTSDYPTEVITVEGKSYKLKPVTHAAFKESSRFLSMELLNNMASNFFLSQEVPNVHDKYLILQDDSWVPLHKEELEANIKNPANLIIFHINFLSKCLFLLTTSDMSYGLTVRT